VLALIYLLSLGPQPGDTYTYISDQYSCTVSKCSRLLVKFSLPRAECFTLTLSLGVIPNFPASIAINDISLKTRFFGLHFGCRKYWCIFNHFYVIRPKAIEFGEITLRLGLLRRLMSSKVTEFGTNRKLIFDFLLVINTNVAPIVHRFRDIAFDRSNMDIYSATPLVFNSPTEGFP